MPAPPATRASHGKPCLPFRCPTERTTTTILNPTSSNFPTENSLDTRYQHWAAYHKFQPFTIFQTESSDGGRTWTEARPLGCCGSPPHLLLHSSGALVCTYGRREAPLGESAMVSWDGGKNWQLDYAIDATAPSGDLGYPASVEMADHSILTVYYQKPEKDELCTLMYTRWELPRKKG